MQIFILIHEQLSVVNDQEFIDSYDIISVTPNIEKVKRAFSVYLDALENEWRNDNLGVKGVFNRLCELTDNFLMNASCEGHRVYILVTETD